MRNYGRQSCNQREYTFHIGLCGVQNASTWKASIDSLKRHLPAGGRCWRAINQRQGLASCHICGFELPAYEGDALARPRSGATWARGVGGVPGLSPRAKFRDSSGVLRTGDCVALPIACAIGRSELIVGCASRARNRSAKSQIPKSKQMGLPTPRLAPGGSRANARKRLRRDDAPSGALSLQEEVPLRFAQHG